MSSFRAKQNVFLTDTTYRFLLITTTRTNSQAKNAISKVLFMYPIFHVRGNQNNKHKPEVMTNLTHVIECIQVQKNMVSHAKQIIK